MTIPEDRLTAYALDDPGLTVAERAEAEAALAADPAARAEVEATRQLAAALAAALKCEQATLTADVPLTVAPKPVRRWPAYAAGLASGLAVALAVAVLPTMTQSELQTDDVALRVEKESVEPDNSVDGPDASTSLPRELNKAAVPGTEAEARPAPAGDVAVTPLEAMGAIKLSGPSEKALKEAIDGLAGEGRRSGTSDAPTAATPPSPSPAPGGRGGPPTGRGGTPGGLGGQGGFGGGGFNGQGGGFGGSPGVAGPGFGSGGFGGGGISGGGGQGGFGGQGGLGGGGGSGHLAPAVGSPPAANTPKQVTASQPGVITIAPSELGDGSLAKAPAIVANPGLTLPLPGPSIPNGGYYANPYYQGPPTLPDQQRYPQLVENRFVAVEGQAALSTFGVDVDTASYSLVRNYLLSQNSLPPPAAVRLEEIVNYFPYQDKPPTGDDPFAVTVEVAQCPWAPGHRLARIGVKAKPIDRDKRPPSNLVFLIDVSGSMSGPNRLPLVKSSLKQLIGQLGENDRVAMVAYAGASGIVLDSTSAAQKDVLTAALDRLESGGSTNGSGGIQDAYAVATAHFLKEGTNRVIVCTDGDWNVGTTGTDQLVQLIEEKRKTGVFLSVLGFGMGNLRDEMMVKLAGKGNGNYGYIDTEREAHKALVEQLSGTIVTVAKDVKIQVEFNPAAVSAYRLLGYEKRHLNAEDFHNDAKDAGEMGAGHTVTALYELVPAGPASEQPGVGLKYQQAAPVADKPAAAEAFTVKMRHKKPDADVSTYRELPVKNEAKSFGQASEDFRFSAAAAGYALLLRNSEFKGSVSFEAVLDWAAGAMTFDPSGYRAEFLELARKAKALGGK